MMVAPTINKIAVIRIEIPVYKILAVKYVNAAYTTFVDQHRQFLIFYHVVVPPFDIYKCL